jgi:hypothetical protein
MAENNSESWKDLCDAAVEAKDSNELLRIINQLCEALDREKLARQVLPPATKSSKKALSTAASTRG